MTEQEFTHISRIKSEIEDLTKILYGEYEGAKNCCIAKITVTEEYEDGMEDKEYVISDGLEEEIKKIIKKRLEKLQEEFDNFKTE